MNEPVSKYQKMKQLIADLNLPSYRYKQLLDAVFKRRIMRFEDMTQLPKTLREKLIEQFGETVIGIKVIHHETSAQTDKVLFELPDGNRVETVGIVPGIQRITEEYPQVNLAYSLHAPTCASRETLMPVTKTYPPDLVLDTLDKHIQKTNRKVFLAYIMLKDVNDSDKHALELIELLSKHKKYLPLYHLDLIPYNQPRLQKA